MPNRIAQILNFAGHHLYSHAWNWRERTAANLDFTTNDFVVLPDDVGTILNVYPNGNTFRRVFLISPEAFSRFESDNLTITDAVFYVTLARAKPGNDGTEVRSSLHDGWTSTQPQVQPSQTLCLSVTGLSLLRLQAVTLTATEIPVESHVEALYLECPSLAEGGEVGDTLQRVAMVDASPLLQEAMRRDGVETPNWASSYGCPWSHHLVWRPELLP